MNKQLLDALGEMDDRFIAEAAPASKKKHPWYRWAAAAAACLALVAAALALPLGQENPTESAANGRYKYTTLRQNEAALVLRWEDKTLSERYTWMEFGGKQYNIRNSIDESLLGDCLGTCQASGFDDYTDQVYSETFEVYAINGQQADLFVALKLGENYYVYFVDEFEKPATLGQLLAETNLQEALPLSRFSDYTEGKEGCYLLSSDAEIWAILAGCADAPLVEDLNFRTDHREMISFTATSEPLGVYKHVLYITADGYLWSNVFNVAIQYQIGEEAASRIIAYAQENCAETEFEPYTNSVAGTITEIGDGYLLIDDAVLCWNEADGIVFKVLTDAPTFARWLKYYNFQVGDVVFIEYRGAVEAGNVISGAYSISEAILADGHILVPE